MKTLRRLFLIKALLALVISPTMALGNLLPEKTSPIDSLANAIAKAEGFYTKGTIPNRYHNPGDIKFVRGYKYFGQVRVGKGGHIVFRNDAAGWMALREQLRKMIEGESKFYKPSMSLRQIAKKYAGNYRVWASNVAHNLGVPEDTTIQELFDIPPQYDPRWAVQR